MQAFVVDEPRSRALRALNYSPAVERIRRAGSTSAVPLREVIRSFGRAYGTVFTRTDCDPDRGVELLSQGDMFAAEPRGRVIRRDSMHQPDRHLIDTGQVLIAGAGTLGENELYGRSIWADARLAGKYVGPHSMTLVFNDPADDFSYFTYAWLASPTGIQAIRSTSYGTKVLSFRPDLLQSLPVPRADAATIKRVASLIKKCNSGRESWLQTLTLARSLIEALPEMLEAREMCANRSRRSLMWEGPLRSLCAWNAVSTGGALRHLQSKWPTTLADLVEDDGIYNGPRFTRVDCVEPFGVEFMSQRDAMLIRPAPRRIVKPPFTERLLFAKPGTILVGSHGTLGEGEIFGRAFLVHGAHSRAAFTQDLLRVVPKPGLSEAVYAFLTTDVGFRLLRSTAVGTKILSMREDMLRALPTPTWPVGMQERVKGLVARAFASRIEADDAEREAFRIIEQEVLPQWLA